MARNNQKLINFHTSGNTEVPLESLFYGEIAVRHCSGDSAAELIIKNSENTSAVFVETAKMCIDCGTWDGGDSHEYVDLGLPSGTLWATCNIGANLPEEFGLYFQWGDTQGYTSAQVGTDKVFSWANYKYSSAGSSSVMTKYNSSDGKTVLDLEDDAAYVNWGENWRMPTVDQISELIDSENTSHEFTSMNNVEGILFTSLSNGNTLFVPSAGLAYGTSVDGIGEVGGCWSLLNSEYVGYAQELYFNWMEDDVYVYNYERYYGFSVRPVRVQNQ